MGQVVQGIVLGITPKKGQIDKLYDEDGDLVKGAPKVGRIESGTDGQVFGLAVAVANVYEEKDGEVDIPVCPVEELANALRTPLAKAWTKWNKLSVWAASKGVSLGEPKVILVPVERA